MRLVALLVLLGLCAEAMALSRPACHPLLWPVGSAILDNSYVVPKALLHELQASVAQFSNASPRPVEKLASAGQTNLNDVNLIASRLAFLDADHAVLCALFYYLTHDKIALNKARAILSAWALKNHPTGQPIDETRLDTMIWAYDLIACDLSIQEKKTILMWLKQIRDKKLAWIFQQKTQKNNHHVHQLKMLLLLDKVLQDKQAFKQHSLEAKSLRMINLDSKSGVSVDFTERSALFYHNFVLQAWLEISLITGELDSSTIKAYAFLMQQMSTGHIHHEFVKSSAKIDNERGLRGFAYAKKDSTFDVMRSVPTVILYYTLISSMPNSDEWARVLHAKSSPKIVFLKARRMLWTH